MGALGTYGDARRELWKISNIAITLVLILFRQTALFSVNLFGRRNSEWNLVVEVSREAFPRATFRDGRHHGLGT